MISYIVVISIVTLDIILGLFIFLKNPKSKINRIFLVLTFWVLVWIGANFLENEPILADYRSLLLKIDFASAIFLAYYFFFFCINFPKNLNFSRIQRISLILLAFIFFILSFSSLIIKNFSFSDSTIQFERGILYWVYTLMILSYVGIGSLSLIFRFKKLQGSEKIQTLYIILGFVLSGIVAIIVNLILTQIMTISTEIYRIGIYGISFFIFFTAYALIKYHLMNVKLVLTEILVAVGSLILVIDSFLSLNSSIVFLKLGILVAFIYLGVSLIRSVLKEVQQREKIEELSKYKSELLSIVAHQIKNPLAVIKGYATLIKDKTVSEPNLVSEIIQKIHVSACRLIDLLNNLLDLGHIEDGKMHYDFEEIELNKFLKDIAEDFQFVAQQKNLELVFKSTPQKVLIKGDSYKLSQVFRNLIDNAIKYTEKGFVKIAITRTDTDYKSVLITISDSGMGMSQESIGKLFQKFVRGAQEEITGSGLGLYIGKQIIEAHQGKIWAESEGEDKGSSFFVELPML
jgi:signal transduction histidine kinase